MDVSLKGTSLEHDVDDMEAAYGEGTTPADVLMVRAGVGAWATCGGGLAPGPREGCGVGLDPMSGGMRM